MFKCIHIQTGESILILDADWQARLVELREWDRAGHLVCQGCLQPVRVRAGYRRRWHFAHKHLANCAFDRVSIALLNARALLYRWLLSHFDAVEIEVEWHRPEVGLTRPVDAVVSHAGRQYAYWLIENRLKPSVREQMTTSFSKMEMPVHVLFLSRLMQPDENNPNQVNLTTTERAFLNITSFDPIFQVFDRPVGKTAHYLDVDEGTLSTYRDLHCVHKPQVFAGVVRCSALENVSVSHETGDLHHPGEIARLNNLIRDMKHRKRKIESTMDSMGSIMKKILPRGTPPEIHEKSAQDHRTINVDVPQPDDLFREQAVCQFCGSKTADWWYLDKKTGQCKCRDCLKQGLS